MSENFDLTIVGAGSAGIIAAKFAGQIGAKVALVDNARIGGDCTWTGCVPSKSLLRVARAAQEARTSSAFGVDCKPAVNFARVNAFVRGNVARIYGHTTPEEVVKWGAEPILGPTRFLDAHTLQVGERRLASEKLIICTGAEPIVPAIEGLASTPFRTYKDIFDLEELPARLAIIGGGPIGIEMAQAFARLGSHVSVVAEKILPRDEPEAAAIIQRKLEREGVCFVLGSLATRVKQTQKMISIEAHEEVQADMILVAVGRKPKTDGLGLEEIGVQVGKQGVLVDEKLRTTTKHIYAAGDCTGGCQFSHYAGYQGFQAARNALIIGSASGTPNVVPWCTFTEPEVAHVGLTEAEARASHAQVEIAMKPISETDRGICENDLEGFLKITHRGGTILGATIVANRAGEMINEFVIAMKHDLKLTDLASPIHVYPSYGTDIQLMASDVAIRDFFDGNVGKLAKSISGR